MPSPQVTRFADALRRHARDHNTLEAARDGLRAELEGIFDAALTATQEDNLREAFEIVRKDSVPVDILRTKSMYAPRPVWYTGPKVTDKHWPALKSFLVNSKGWSEHTVNETIGATSTEIVSLLEDPAQAQFSCRGLVVGYVQSGKTANMTAVIAKAVDAGYNFVIVLAGITNKLRQQTQRRLESDVADRYRDLWQLLTTSDEKGDFVGLANGAIFVPPPPLVQMAVVKKNVAPLKRLIKAISNTPPVSVRRLKVLVIDDEADQASVNSASNELNMTRINELIRRLLHSLPSAAYVGYTATPFANVFINPYGKNGELDDLYPKDFITALPKPDGYFGTEGLFGIDPLDPANPLPTEEGLDMIRAVTSEEVALLQPRRRDEKEAFQPLLPPSLEDSILYFLTACAARRVRGHANQHMSMLVHTSSFVAMHNKLAALIEAWLKVNRLRLLDPSSEMGKKLRRVWECEQGRLPADITAEEPVAFDVLAPKLAEVFDAPLEVAIENGLSTDRIDYSGRPKTYIVVGGSVLARGLTLEGLMVSYFLRSSSQYDTLLQMGRWFGYRPGYEDLPRIWMTEDLEESFRSLATIEREIRDDIAQYSERKVSPREFAVRVRALPGMAITAPAKMRAAVECDISYSGKHIQTIQFDHRNETVAQRNWQATVDLVSTAETLRLRSDDRDRLLYRGVPKNLIVQFLRKFSISSLRNDLKPEFLTGYINGTDTDLDLWNVAVVTSSKGEPTESSLGALGHINTVVRSRLKQDSDGPANIKALMSRADVMLDCPGVPFDSNSDWDILKKTRLDAIGAKPLLLLYPVNKVSEPRPNTKSREALDACGDQVGIGIVFPGSAAGAGGYYHVNLNLPSSEDLDAMDAEMNELEEQGLVA
jgi:hypothetical protein